MVQIRTGGAGTRISPAKGLGCPGLSMRPQRKSHDMLWMENEQMCTSVSAYSLWSLQSKPSKPQRFTPYVVHSSVPGRQGCSPGKFAPDFVLYVEDDWVDHSVQFLYFGEVHGNQHHASCLQ